MELIWNKVTNATGYKLFFGKDDPPTVLITDAGDVDTYTIDNLEYNTKYYWKIVPYNSVGDAEECPVWTFETTNVIPTTTIAPTTTSAPLPLPITTIITPSESDTYHLPVIVSDFTNIGTVSIKMIFDPTVVDYKGVTINPALVGALANVVSDTGNTSVFILEWIAYEEKDVISLSDDEVLYSINFTLKPTTETITTFKFSQINGDCEYASYGGQIIYNSIFNDLTWALPEIPTTTVAPTTTMLPTTTVAPTVPLPSELVYPSNNVLNVPLEVTFEWEHSATATGYKLYSDSMNPPEHVVDTGYVNEYTIRPDILEEETKYYWQVVPYNKIGDAVNCPVYAFVTTGSAPLLTRAINPQDGSTEVPIDLTLEWAPVEKATGYKVFFGPDNEPPLYYFDVGNNTSWVTKTLQYGTEYFWRVIPYNYYGDAEGCPMWTFNTTEEIIGNRPPVIEPQKFACEAYKNFNDVGVVKAYDPDPSQTLTWEIIKGNELDYFYIESCSGKLVYFKDPNLKPEYSGGAITNRGDIVKEFELVVKVTDDNVKPLSSTASMFIQVHYKYTFNIADIDAKVLSKSFEQPIKGTTVTLDGKVVSSNESKETTFDATLNNIETGTKGEYRMVVLTGDNKTVSIKIQN